MLPHSLISDTEFEMHAFYESADEVGGDYYDFFKTAAHKTAVIIGDVSGKGTSASFNMSQMKGVFHSLVQFDLDSKSFFTKANHALSHCLEKTSFITAAYYIINSQEKSISFSRAGHCPGLFYCKKEKKAEYFHNKGMGLGIVRNDSFEEFIDINKIHYSSGDILFLYTDGIIEATNSEGEEFGYDRLSSYLEGNSEKNPKEIQDGLIKYLYDFIGSENLEDDYTALIIRFL